MGSELLVLHEGLAKEKVRSADGSSILVAWRDTFGIKHVLVELLLEVQRSNTLRLEL